MTTDDRTRLLTIALELRLGSLVSGSGDTGSFPPSRLVEIAEALEAIAHGEDVANANDPKAPGVLPTAKGVADGNR